MRTASIESNHLSQEHQPLSEPETRWMVELYDIQSRASSSMHELIWRFLQASKDTRSQIGEVIDQATTGFEEERDSLQSEIALAATQLADLQRERQARQAEPLRTIAAQPREQLAVTTPELRQIETSLSQLRAFEAEARATMSPASATGQAPDTLDILILGVTGYKDAAAIVRALRQAASVSETDITQFAPGQLHLCLSVSSTVGITEQIVAASPLPLSVLGEDAAGLTFRVIQAP